MTTRKQMMKDALLVLRPTPEEREDCIEDVEWALNLLDLLAMLQASRNYNAIMKNIRRGNRRTLAEIRQERANKRRGKFTVVP